MSRYSEIGHKEFDELMDEFCPDIPRQVSCLWGVSYGPTWWSSWSRLGVAETLILRMSQKIKEGSK